MVFPPPPGGGEGARIYPWGSEWADDHANTKEADINRTTPVGAFPLGVSPYGALDMSGNVAEWVADRYSAGYYAESPPENPTGPEIGSLRVVRGGSWGIGQPALLSATLRSSFPPASQNAGLGFRCAIAASDVSQ